VIKNIKLILFDLDGVIIDTKKNMQLSWKKVQKRFNLNISFNQYFKYIGLPFEKILTKLLVKNNLADIHKTYQKESIKQLNKIKLYPGVQKTLKNLRKKKIILGIVTSKDRYRTIKLINKFKMNIKIVVPPSNNLRGKPFPDQLIKAGKMAKIKSSYAIYVGDMLVDYKAAKNSGMNFVHARYGYGKSKKFYRHSIKKFKNLLDFIDT
tara:strand:- start:2047 stop:2670 length:624 start_codon:yes stop_codon:yes gene_type:complete